MRRYRMTANSCRDTNCCGIDEIDPQIGGAVKKVLPNIISALKPPEDPVVSKTALLKKFGEIDGSTKKTSLSEK